MPPALRTASPPNQLQALHPLVCLCMFVFVGMQFPAQASFVHLPIGFIPTPTGRVIARDFWERQYSS